MKIHMPAKNGFLAVTLCALALVVESVTLDWVSDPIYDTVRAQATLGNFLQASLSSAEDALAETAADTEMGNDIAVDIGVSSASNRSHALGDDGPSTLAEYCSGAPTSGEKQMEMKEGTKVNADWRNYGTFYPGKIEKKNPDGTVNISYDDGFTEDDVTHRNVKIRKAKKKESKEEKKNPRDDPACELQEYVNKLKKKFGKLNADLQNWLVAQRAKVAQGQSPDAPPSIRKPVAVAAAPAPAAAVEPASEEKTDELEGLKVELSDLDEQIAQMERTVAANDEALHALHESDSPAAPAPAVKTVDDLIAEYKDRIQERHHRIDQLKEKIKQQQVQLSRLGMAQCSLGSIHDAVEDLVKEADKVQAKRLDLEKQGKLDDELRVIVDGIIKSIMQMRAKVANLLEKERKNNEGIAKAKMEAAKAARLAAEEAENEGKSPEEVTAEAEKAAVAAQARMEKERKELETDTLKAAEELDTDLKDAEKRTEHLDTGLHPHGEKWWRYRYEHSYVEALIMIFIVILYLLWNIFVVQLKHRIGIWALPAGQKPKTLAEEAFEESHGLVYRIWLHHFALEMLVCILVFLTVWLISKTPLFYTIPYFIRPSKDMRVPNDGEEYWSLALDIMTIFFFAIVGYFWLMLSVAHEAWKMTNQLEGFDADGAGSATPRIMQRPSSPAIFATGAAQWGTIKEHFVHRMTREMQKVSSPEYIEIMRMLGGELKKFPLWLYLRLNVRLQVVHLFALSWGLWLPVVLIFVCLMCLHRFAHMGYIRIMLFFSFCLLAIIMSMYWKVTELIKKIESKTEDPRDEASGQSIHEKINTEGIYMCALQFALFFICYGVSRTVCQPWMWELHFWPVFCICILAIVSVVLFIWLVAPKIPEFCAIMAMPPYVDPENVKTMIMVANEVGEKRRASRS